eukprot:CAMPEP_0204835266 /NCGR_PEP_ID=MMETSP1346-20131115/22099_1 /ASSEMBLY_ACC=CAM_ASM_000771 /TAXON_ID=215587 /ORGANISM="Aplanochytrium stocchinoi, Strain GSBS06" /LENGTH=53 /DNA_ID=CAMNT_0051969117 /DNA_START=106 /DNA_END=267 /DNA_ORIENTATION=+
MALQGIRFAAKFDPSMFAVGVEAVENIDTLEVKKGTRSRLVYAFTNLDKNTCS